MIELPEDEAPATQPSVFRTLVEALWYAGILLAVIYLWHAPEADFRYFGL